MIKGKIISGSIHKLSIRKKAEATISIGELLAVDQGAYTYLLQVIDIAYGSQLSQANMELAAGLQLEQDTSLTLYEQELRQYVIVTAKMILVVDTSVARRAKSLPPFFSDVRDITKDDFRFLQHNEIYVGQLRSGSHTVDVPISLPLHQTITHHMLICATTGKGKSNLMRVLLWNMMNACGVLVLDPHDEYWSKTAMGINHHPSQKVVYYTAKTPPPGQRSLKINVTLLEPKHFMGITDFSSPQRQCMQVYHAKFKHHWIEQLFIGQQVQQFIHDDTLGVVRRKLATILSLTHTETSIKGHGIFDTTAGMHTFVDIMRCLEQKHIVIIDTSQVPSAVELLIGSCLATHMFDTYKQYSAQGVLEQKPALSIVLEEAPRVLGKQVLEKGINIFGTIAREGRKFHIGLCALTQLPSLIPKDILANMNTKCILGLEMAPERQAIIESAAQDLSDDSRTIASLDKGEAIISSNFIPFAVPVSIPLFSKVVQETLATQEPKSGLHISGLKG
ncbi:MAG: ATP-binding protein [Candidatus Woesearchaeota archaeon]